VVLGAAEMRALAAALRADPSRPFGFAMLMPTPGGWVDGVEWVEWSGCVVGWVGGVCTWCHSMPLPKLTEIDPELIQTAATAAGGAHVGKLFSMALPPLPAAAGGVSPPPGGGGGNSGGPEALEGIAIAVGDGCAFYVPLVQSAHGREYKEVAAEVASLLEDPQLTKVFNVVACTLGCVRDQQTDRWAAASACTPHTHARKRAPHRPLLTHPTRPRSTSSSCWQGWVRCAVRTRARMRPRLTR
jgi:hypothetical protein